MALGLGSCRNHVEASRCRGPFLLAAVPGGQCLHFLEKLLESGGMMDDQQGRAVAARVVKAMDSLSRDEGEGAGSGRVRLIADAQHQLAFEDVEELVTLAVIVRPCANRPWRHSPFPDGAQTVGLYRRRLDRHARTR